MSDSKTDGGFPVIRVLLLVFLTVGGVFVYLAGTVTPGATTNDGHDLGSFYTVMATLFIGFPVLLTTLYLLIVGKAAIRMRNLQKRGLNGKAVVVTLRETGNLINDSPEVKMKLRMQLPGIPEYEVVKRMVVPLTKVPMVQPGESIKVVADPIARTQETMDVILD